MAATEEIPPQIVLIPLSRSHPFNQRECIVSEPVKVGRPVDKKKITPNNLIFDCRVLSRNHALIWYETGKFYIQDTKSSNGTFVNDCRLSPSGEESTPRELTTRDVVQFGVNVNVDKRVTHGCIIATIKLYINGKEIPGPDPDIQQIVQVVQNCLNKEQEFEAKLMSMHESLAAAHAFAKENMINIVKEDELLSRLEMLENQLHVYSRNVGEDDIRKQLAKALEEKHNNTVASKERVQLILQEKIDCATRLSQVQRDYDKAEEECQKYKTLYEALKQEHSQQMSKLTEQLKTAEKQKTELVDKAKEEAELVMANQESIKTELQRVEDQLLESQNKLSQMNVDLQSAQQDGGHSTVNSNEEVESGSLNEESDCELDNPRSEDWNTESSLTSEKIEDKMLMTITSGLAQGHSEPLAFEGNERKLQEELQTSRRRMEELIGEVTELGAAKEDLLKQLQDMKVELTSERTEKALLLEAQHKNVGNKHEEVHVGNAINNDQHTLTAEERLQEQLKAREDDLTALHEERDRLLSRVTFLESENKRQEKDDVSSHSELVIELAASKKESDEMRERIAAFQEQLKEVRNDSSFTTPTSTSLDPLLANSPDARIKVLSIITLASIAVALLSVLIAYFF